MVFLFTITAGYWFKKMDTSTKVTKVSRQVSRHLEVKIHNEDSNPIKRFKRLKQFEEEPTLEDLVWMALQPKLMAIVACVRDVARFNPEKYSHVFNFCAEFEHFKELALLAHTTSSFWIKDCDIKRICGLFEEKIESTFNGFIIPTQVASLMIKHGVMNLPPAPTLQDIKITKDVTTQTPEEEQEQPRMMILATQATEEAERMQAIALVEQAKAQEAQLQSQPPVPDIIDLTQEKDANPQEEEEAQEKEEEAQKEEEEEDLPLWGFVKGTHEFSLEFLAYTSGIKLLPLPRKMYQGQCCCVTMKNDVCRNRAKVSMTREYWNGEKTSYIEDMICERHRQMILNASIK